MHDAIGVAIHLIFATVLALAVSTYVVCGCRDIYDRIKANRERRIHDKG